MKFTKKIIAIFMALTVALSTGALTANAATVYLKSAQTSATSSTVYGYNKVFYGNNSKDSAYSVYFIAKYKKGGIWYTDKSKLIGKGENCPTTNTSALSVERDWHLKLNPEGAGHYGCIATGYIYND